MHYPIKLVVSAPDDLRGEVTSYLSRELRRIGDVTVVDENPLIVISVVALRTGSRDGRASVVAFSVVVDQPENVAKNYQTVCGTMGITPDKMTVGLLTTFGGDNVVRLMAHFLEVGASDEVESVCRKVVVEFDGEVLEGQRRQMEQLLEQAKKLQPAAPK